MIKSFNEFCEKLLESGFSMGGGNPKGIYAIIPFDWKNPIPGCPIAWHTGDAETDPWEWRRRGLAFDEWYFEGRAGLLEKKIYEAIEQCGHMALHELKKECDITKETSGRFDKALTNLQKNLFITMCGRKQKVSSEGKPYGWNSTVFTTVENFWGEDMTMDISVDEAYEKIRERILDLNPEAKENDIKKFIVVE